jgi:hypothetical protein
VRVDPSPACFSPRAASRCTRDCDCLTACAAAAAPAAPPRHSFMYDKTTTDADLASMKGVLASADMLCLGGDSLVDKRLLVSPCSARLTPGVCSCLALTLTGIVRRATAPTSK